MGYSTTNPAPTTFTFDADNKLELDVYVPSREQAGGVGGEGLIKVPAMVHYHRGGMLVGTKSDVFPPWMPGRLASQGMILISPNYRLLFPSSADDIITDVRTLFAYLSSPTSELAQHLAASGLALDTSRIIVTGVSGGNYPARAAATLRDIVPRPVGWLDLFGMGGDWFLDFWVRGVDVERSMPRETTLHDLTRAEELVRSGGGPVISEVESVLVDGKATDELGRFNLWIKWQKEGTFLNYVLDCPGLSKRLAEVPYEERAGLVPEDKRRLLLPITRDTPPTYLMHGTEDLLVPIEESKAVERELAALGIPVEVDWVEGADHALRDRVKGGWEGYIDDWEGVADRAIDWAVARLKTGHS
ncbi:hypothetical protein IAT38_006625 [Cryptococcus sp. DSM 104549]